MAPHWFDCCDHNRPNDRFLGTIHYEDITYDVYVYQDNALGRMPDMHVCLRYGNEGREYLSPGPVDQFLFRAHLIGGTYALAAPLVARWRIGQ